MFNNSGLVKVWYSNIQEYYTAIHMVISSYIY